MVYIINKRTGYLIGNITGYDIVGRDLAGECGRSHVSKERSVS